MEGGFAIGVHGAKPDPRDPAARTIVVWVESPTGVQLAITDANRLDHQIWWAACFPEQAGKDPVTLQALARKLGYSGQLREQQQVLPGSPR